MSKNYIIYISGINCISCSQAIELKLTRELSSRFLGFSTDLISPNPKKTIITLADERGEQEVYSELKKYIEELGFVCEQAVAKPGEIEVKQGNNLRKILASGNKVLSSHCFLGILGSFAGITVLITCLASNPLPFSLMLLLASSSLILTLLLGANSYYQAWSKWIKSGTLTMDSLFALSSLSILAVSLASLFLPWLPMMFDAGLLIHGFRHIGVAIEDSIKEKISSARFQDRAPKRIKKISLRGIEESPLDQIQAKDVIIIGPGEIIPLDGICQNASSIYDTIITGAILPHRFQPQQKVLAGMRLADNAPPLTIYVSKIQKDSYLAQLDAAIEQTSLEKAPLELKTAQLLNYFIPTVIALATSSGVLLSFFFPATIAIQCATSVLLSACPCTLGLIIPLAVKTGIYKAAKNGVRFKSAKTLQEAGEIDTVVFDLNGTLTTGIPQVKEFQLFADCGLSEQEILEHCSALEKKSTHPIGKAIYSFTKPSTTPNLIISDIDESDHSGISAKINGQNYAIGSSSLMKAHKISLPQTAEAPALNPEDHRVYLARGNKVIAYMTITDPLRGDAYQIIQRLMAMGKEVHLCTGTDKETAERYAEILGISQVYADCSASPTDKGGQSKTAYIDSLVNRGCKVAMIGDAANDTQAMVKSTFSIAVTSDGGDELTQQTAGAVVHKKSLLPVLSAFTVAKQTVANIEQNLLISLGYNLGTILSSGGLLLGLGVPLPPIAGLILMILQACCILMNVYRFKQEALQHLQEEIGQEHRLEKSSPTKMNQNMPGKNKTYTANPGLSNMIFFREGLFRKKTKADEGYKTILVNPAELRTPTSKTIRF